ncbi:hypothetical protein FE374_13680 [Georgenia yuyongxinii]|uniref:MinD-like ATPase involved in chromosome partitioning or flagellar assembly n=1 Tax=Georgenia yuyongxinii TaxID=2589797 RepID=A0A5B8C4M1_9MICO|nr:hypothetical protein [Georgenia yuyongxinii]QDC25523.1 hypothetical protein FE374_13680 [Georgenia yuyongxinii]
MTTGVLLALTGAEEGAVVRALDAPGTGMRVVRRCADVPEVLAAASAGLGAVAVLAADLPGVDRTVTARLRATGVRTLLVARDQDRERCAALGADAVGSAGADPGFLAAQVIALARAAPGTDAAPTDVGSAPTALPPADLSYPEPHHSGTSSGGGDGGGPGAGDGAGDPQVAGGAARVEFRSDRGRGAVGEPTGARRGDRTAGATDAAAMHATPATDDAPQPDDARKPGDARKPDYARKPDDAAGRLVVVWGPPGAPGRTTVAVTLAAEMARLRPGALLVDADTEAPSVTQVLGLLDDSSAIAVAARHASHGRLDPATLGRLCPIVDDDLRVLTGLTRADRWRELPGAALEVVWETARRVSPWSVVDVGAGLGDDAGFDPVYGPQRHQAATSALAAADVVVVVGAGEPVGMRRLVMALSDLADRAVLRPDVERVVVVNRVRPSAAGPHPTRSILEALTRFAGVTDAVLVPDDRPSLDKAVLLGSTLTAAAPGSPARHALQALAARLVGEPTAGRRRARLGLARRR